MTLSKYIYDLSGGSWTQSLHSIEQARGGAINLSDSFRPVPIATRIQRAYSSQDSVDCSSSSMAAGLPPVQFSIKTPES